MKSLYNKIFKNNQVTYGRPFQVRVPINLHNMITILDTEADDNCELSPEELLEKARQECELLIKEAGFEADRLLEQAKLKAETETEVLMEEAWQKGYAEGMEAACAQNEAILAEAEQIRLSASQEHESILAGLESEIVELVLGIARKAVAGELATNREVILQLIGDALSDCSNKNGAVLKVSPLDCDYLNDHKEKLYNMVVGADGLDIKKDSTLRHGDCIIETLLGSVDGGANTRLDKIEEAFREQLEGR